EVSSRNPRTGILDDKSHGCAAGDVPGAIRRVTGVAARRGVNGDHGASRRELDGVGQQVDEYLEHTIAVALECAVRLHMLLDLHVKEVGKRVYLVERR